MLSAYSMKPYKPISEKRRNNLSILMKEKWKGEEYRNHMKQIYIKKLPEYNQERSLYRINHIQAGTLHRKNYCMTCGMSRLLSFKIYLKDLHMHCIDRNYTNMNKLNWMTLCAWCHIENHRIDQLAISYSV